mmetsp:Transcript_101487/g.160481  ORF Transcript_101487/g.160481 Transcript_101487/m.160481 type:complete len:90 (+) Transcript_101487:48-317(+)
MYLVLGFVWASVAAGASFSHRGAKYNDGDGQPVSTQPKLTPYDAQAAHHESSQHGPNTKFEDAGVAEQERHEETMEEDSRYTESATEVV